MKKRILRILLLSLSFFAVLLFAACGKSETASSSTPAPGGDSQETAEFAYRSSFISVEKGPNGAPSPVLYTDDGYYAMGSELVETRIPEGKTVEYQGQYDIYASFLYRIHPDGSIEKLKNFEPVMPEEDTEGRTEFSSYSSLQRPLMTADGNLISLIENYAYWFDGPEDALDTEDMWQYYKYEQTYQIMVLSPDGTRISLADVDFDEPDSYLNGYNAVLDPDGNMLVTQDMNVLAISPDGSIAYRITGEDYIYNLLSLPDGRIAVMRDGENGPGLLTLDLEKKSFGETISIPEGAWSIVPGYEDYDILFNSGMYLYGYRFGEEDAEQILKWIDVDISSDTVDTGTIQILPDGTIRGTVWDYSNAEPETELFTLTRVPASELPKKEVLTIAQIEYYDYNLNNRIVQFNRKHNDVRLELVDYTSNNTEEDFGAGVTKFTTELMAGNSTDIIPLSQLPYRQLAAKGMLEDLYPYIDKDPDIKREDFFPNELEELEVNGGLYQADNGFSVETLTGAASVVGDTPGWTYADYEEALSKMPEDCDPLDPCYTRDVVMEALLSANMDRFV
ncbi:MAG: extracellular solute-binding protein, partial [Oscillospiraceae bacterium]|nr:extracellular solute-binding protein [Oscillospiraceae bacterium]